jgi:hypothetical protein
MVQSGGGLVGSSFAGSNELIHNLSTDDFLFSPDVFYNKSNPQVCGKDAENSHSKQM